MEGVHILGEIQASAALSDPSSRCSHHFKEEGHAIEIDPEGVLGPRKEERGVIDCDGQSLKVDGCVE